MYWYIFVLLCLIVWGHEIEEDVRLEDNNVTNIFEYR